MGLKCVPPPHKNAVRGRKKVPKRVKPLPKAVPPPPKKRRKVRKNGYRQLAKGVVPPLLLRLPLPKQPRVRKQPQKVPPPMVQAGRRRATDDVTQLVAHLPPQIRVTHFDQLRRRPHRTFLLKVLKQFVCPPAEKKVCRTHKPLAAPPRKKVAFRLKRAVSLPRVLRLPQKDYCKPAQRIVVVGRPKL